MNEFSNNHRHNEIPLKDDFVKKNQKTEYSSDRPIKIICRLVQESLYDCVNDTSLYGLPKSIKKNYHIVVRISWMMAFIGLSAYGIYGVVQLFQAYFSYPSYITTKLVQELPTQFPAVSFCNMKNIDRKTSFAQAYITPIYTQNSFANLPTFQLMEVSFYHNLYQINSDPGLNYTSRKLLGFQIEDMLVSCSYNYNICNSTDFKYFYHAQYGNCYTFNGDLPTKTISMPGRKYGLIMEFYLGNPDVDTVDNYEDGVFVSIDNQSDVPFTKTDVLKVAAGSDTDFIMNRNFQIKLPPPYGNCMKNEFSSDLYDYIVNTLQKTYSQDLCFSLCIQQQSKRYCGCSNVFLPLFLNDSTNICSLSNEKIKCFLDIIDNSSSYDTCKNMCPFECNKVEFEISSKHGLYPTNYYQKVLQAYAQYKNLSVSFANIPKAFAKLNVFYHSMEYKLIQQTQAYQINDLIAGLGGILGLCLGFSLLSAFEILHLLFNVIHKIINFFLTQSQIKKVAPK